MLSRRLFLKRVAIGGAAAWGLWRRGGHANLSATPLRAAAEHGGTFFKADELLALAVIASQIVPTDDTPGANEGGVVEKIDRRVQASKPLQTLYRSGLREVDALSMQAFGRKFVLLDSTQRREVLVKMEPTEFFRAVRNHTVEDFYGSPIGWRSAGFPGPAQYHGYPDYHQAPK